MFEGRNRVEAKRRALEYWYRHRRIQGVSLKRFIARCRLCHSDERRIIFYPH